jgi:hypothetical protein
MPLLFNIILVPGPINSVDCLRQLILLVLINPNIKTEYKLVCPPFHLSNCNVHALQWCNTPKQQQQVWRCYHATRQLKNKGNRNICINLNEPSKQKQLPIFNLNQTNTTKLWKVTIIITIYVCQVTQLRQCTRVSNLIPHSWSSCSST